MQLLNIYICLFINNNNKKQKQKISAEKRKRATFDIKTKLVIIDKYNNGMKPKELASLYDVNSSTMSTIDSSKQQTKVKDAEDSKAKRTRTSNYPEVEA